MTDRSSKHFVLAYGEPFYESAALTSMPPRQHLSSPVMTILHLQSPMIKPAARPPKRIFPGRRPGPPNQAHIMLDLLRNNWEWAMKMCLLLYPMVVFNPVLLLHLVNGLLSFLQPDAMCNQTFDTWVKPHLDVHANDEFCKIFTVLVVVLQLVIYRPIIDNGEKTSNDGG